MANKNLGAAKAAKNDEFYTQYADIQKEMNAYVEYNPDVFRGKTVLLPCDDPEWSNFTKFFAQNFEFLGLKKLISTSFAVESKKYKAENWQPTLFEQANHQFDAAKTRVRGKIFVLDRDVNGDNRINIDDLEWHYLEGTGDFRSAEVTALRDEADIIITNPPFSLFREFLAWIMEGGKQFSVIGNMNAITYKEVFPLIKENKIWLGTGGGAHGNSMYFIAPQGFESQYLIDYNGQMCMQATAKWFTNLDHGRRHEPLQLMTMADNIKFSKHKEIKGKAYEKVVNYENTINVPFTDAIPSDYDANLAVPISFLDKYCPEQFEIIGIGLELADMGIIKERLGKQNGGPRFYVERDDTLERLYERILIRKRK